MVKGHVCRDFVRSIPRCGDVCKECGFMPPWMTDAYREEHGDKLVETRNIAILKLRSKEKND